jgi:glycosyltransferase involved in cell wall biosynthesis
MDVSVIVPLFNEADNIEILIKSIQSVFENQKIIYELLLIDDGSRDQTYDVIQRMAAKDPRIKGIRFSRNHGQTAALMAGFNYAQGEFCISMDGDLQHDPNQILEFIETIKKGYDLVCSYRFQRNDAFIRRFPSKVANLIAKKISKLNLRDFGSTYRAYRTRLVKDVPIYGEMHRFIPIFISLLTNRITEIPINHMPRIRGTSKYGLSRTFRVFSDLWALMFFSGFFNRPMHIFGYFSLLFGLPGIAILLWLTAEKLLGMIEIMNYGPLFILGVMLSLLAVQMMTTGVVCEYLIRIYYNHDSRRPYHIAETTFDDNIK